jgi:hypothetical protein
MDCHDFTIGYEGSASVLLLSDRYSGLTWDYYLEHRTADSIIDCLKHFIHLWESTYRTKIQVFEVDNEFTTLKPKIKEFLESKHFKVEPSAPYTQAQNGFAERIGAIIKAKARAMRGRLPEELWPEIVRAAVYLYNRTPIRGKNWKSPYECFFETKPVNIHLRVYGCKSYAMTAKAKKKEERLHRLNPRAWIGYLVGYSSTNQYRIWVPFLNRVVITRDVIFDERIVFDGDSKTLEKELKALTLDDISNLVQKLSDDATLQRSTSKLMERFPLTGGDELHWFLGIEIIRDRDRRCLWLSQQTYIERIANLAESKTPCGTPMGVDHLLPFDGLATNNSIRRYQVKIGSLMYAAIITRPDIAYAVAQLARFMVNPGLKHHRAADRVLNYLRATSHLVLELGGGNSLEITSDASFADNLPDRKSTQAYTIRLFGGLVAWRSNKQDTVTTSTTEAELLALSQAARESMFVSRIMKGLSIPLANERIRIQCDNLQTIRLVTQELAKLQTQLRHVDIHNHWLRQEVFNGTIEVVYTPSKEILADGFTKPLQQNEFQLFRERLKVVARE